MGMYFDVFGRLEMPSSSETEIEGKFAEVTGVSLLRHSLELQVKSVSHADFYARQWRLVTINGSSLIFAGDVRVGFQELVGRWIRELAAWSAEVDRVRGGEGNIRGGGVFWDYLEDEVGWKSEYWAISGGEIHIRPMPDLLGLTWGKETHDAFREFEDHQGWRDA